MEKKYPGLAIASMTLGIVGVVLCWAIFLAQILGILAIVFGFISKNSINKSKNLSGKGMAIAGIILGFIAFFLIMILAYMGVLSPQSLLPAK
jgi:hypothetical protein